MSSVLGSLFVGVVNFLALEIDGGAADPADIETVGAGLLDICLGGDADNPLEIAFYVEPVFRKGC